VIFLKGGRKCACHTEKTHALVRTGLASSHVISTTREAVNRTAAEALEAVL